MRGSSRALWYPFVGLGVSGTPSYWSSIILGIFQCAACVTVSSGSVLGLWNLVRDCGAMGGGEVLA